MSQTDFSRSHGQLLTIQFIRITFLILVLGVVLIYQILQSQFISFEIFFSVYSLLGISFLFQLIYILGFDSAHKSIAFGTGFLFIWEAIYVTLLIYFIGVNQSLLIFLYLINIILCGIVFQRRGGIYLALFTSICFSILLATDSAVRGYTLYLAVGVNNIAFFAVAYLSGYLSEQLNFMGVELLERGRDIRALKNLNSLIIDGIPSGLLTIDNQGRILQHNRPAAQILNKGESLLNLQIQNYIPPLQDLLSRFVKDGPSVEAQTVDRNILRISFSPLIDDAHRRLGSIVLFDDITHFKKLESRVAQSEKMAAIGQLAAGIAHEIRNPLASISGSVQMMQADHTQSAENQKLMTIALKEINRLNLLITEFLDYARPSDFKKEPIHFQSLLEEIVDSVKLNPLSRDVKIDLHCTENIYIEGHFDKLKQAFLNIIMNSLQAMESAEKKILILQLSQVQNTAQLKIKDTGVGISAEQVKKIFEPFHTTKAKGTGLGLAIVHSILEAHGAVVDVQSQLGQGTEFSMSFGLAQQASR